LKKESAETSNMRLRQRTKKYEIANLRFRQQTEAMARQEKYNGWETKNKKRRVPSKLVRVLKLS
jgi:hypothetical protein